MWGNDPQLTQREFEENGKRPVEQWINPAADELLRQLKGDRPSWGWNGRMNGWAFTQLEITMPKIFCSLILSHSGIKKYCRPADNFISACASCHGVAQRINVDVNAFDILTQPKPVQDCKAQWIPKDDSKTMLWWESLNFLFQNYLYSNHTDRFSNTGILGKDPGEISGDFNLQLMVGYNYFERLKSDIDSMPPCKDRRKGLGERQPQDRHAPVPLAVGLVSRSMSRLIFLISSLLWPIPPQ